MTWLSRDNDGNGGYRHSIPITSTISVQSYYPHPTSSRPSSINSDRTVNSKFNNKNTNNKNFNNNNFTHSNNAPSHKPTKKTSKCTPNTSAKTEPIRFDTCHSRFSILFFYYLSLFFVLKFVVFLMNYYFFFHFDLMNVFFLSIFQTSTISIQMRS